MLWTEGYLNDLIKHCRCSSTSSATGSRTSSRDSHDGNHCVGYTAVEFVNSANTYYDDDVSGDGSRSSAASASSGGTITLSRKDNMPSYWQVPTCNFMFRVIVNCWPLSRTLAAAFVCVL